MEENDYVGYSISAIEDLIAGEEKAALIVERFQGSAQKHIVVITVVLNRLQTLWMDERLGEKWG